MELKKRFNSRRRVEKVVMGVCMNQRNRWRKSKAAYVSLSSPKKATRKSKRVEGESMLASTEVSKTRRGTSYGGSPLSSPEKATRKSKAASVSLSSQKNATRKSIVEDKAGNFIRWVAFVIPGEGHEEE